MGKNSNNVAAATNGSAVNGHVVSDDCLVKGKPKEKSRYSDEELEEFRLLIKSNFEVAKESYEYHRRIMSNNDGNGTNDTGPTFKVLEEGAQTLSKEEAGRMAQRQFKLSEHLKWALFRIENKTYGKCHCPECNGKLIPKERLKNVPHATKCLNAKNV